MVAAAALILKSRDSCRIGAEIFIGWRRRGRRRCFVEDGERKLRIKTKASEKAKGINVAEVFVLLEVNPQSTIKDTRHEVSSCSCLIHVPYILMSSMPE